MQFERIADKHVVSLLDFELTNKSYFENVIAPREDAFYSLDGVGNHINELLYLQSQKRASSHVLVEHNRILARANIKNIEGDKAEIGYRVAEQQSGKGIATFCVSFLSRQAQEMGITTLTAEVMDNNPASEKALVKNGFRPTFCYIKKHRHQNTLCNSTLYELALHATKLR
ncbi:GNAT family N-acetyltransferase [Alteromonas gracilis]|uniref:GNAT family N-acetyltransferase n=1 Tax=Alteromonas gracilis TaxID=1479524 RepID=UPI0037360881